VMLAQTKAFVNDVSKEMKKVSWPTREQLRESTVVVIVTCLIFTAIVAVIDLGMTQLMKQVY
jgi:preprotein translocase subunit SecE